MAMVSFGGHISGAGSGDSEFVFDLVHLFLCFFFFLNGVCFLLLPESGGRGVSVTLLFTPLVLILLHEVSMSFIVAFSFYFY